MNRLAITELTKCYNGAVQRLKKAPDDLKSFRLDDITG